MTPKVWLIGCGGMSVEYSRALAFLGVDFLVVGRGPDSAATFSGETGLKVELGGIDAVVERVGVPRSAIVAVPILNLADVTLQLMEVGVKQILVEKPLALSLVEAGTVADQARKMGCDVRVAYNRRFYTSVQGLKSQAGLDGGLQSIVFDFTERSVQIALNEHHSQAVKSRWLIANSSHVIDLAFFLAGRPARMDVFLGGSLSWHPNAGFFCGSGITDRGIPFAYLSDWRVSGRWGIEVRSQNRRFLLRPLESLSVVDLERNQTTVESLDYGLDQDFKPGLVRMIEAFLFSTSDDLPTVHEQCELIQICSKMATYDVDWKQA